MIFTALVQMAIYMPRSIRPFSGPGRDWTEVSISGTIAPKQHQKVTQHEVFFYSNRNWRVPQEFVGSVLSITSTNVVNSIMTPKRTIFLFFQDPRHSVCRFVESSCPALSAKGIRFLSVVHYWSRAALDGMLAALNSRFWMGREDNIYIYWLVVWNIFYFP